MKENKLLQVLKVMIPNSLAEEIIDEDPAYIAQTVIEWVDGMRPETGWRR